MRDECLNEHLFTSLPEARRIIEAWRIDYNTERPHTSLNGLTPIEFATRPAEGAGEATGPEAVLCEVGAEEIARDEWRPGYYLLDMSPAQVSDVLGAPAPAFPARLSDAHSP
jgi:Integrase core domain